MTDPEVLHKGTCSQGKPEQGLAKPAVDSVLEIKQRLLQLASMKMAVSITKERHWPSHNKLRRPLTLATSFTTSKCTRMENQQKRTTAQPQQFSSKLTAINIRKICVISLVIKENFKFFKPSWDFKKLINTLKQHKHEENSTFMEYGQRDMSCSYE